MTGRRQNIFLQGSEPLRGGYSALVTACACGLLVLLLWPQAPRTYRAEATVAASSDIPTIVAANDAVAWLKSDEVLRAAIANLRANQPQTLSIALAEAATGDPVQTLRQQLDIVPLASPDEMPRLSIGCRAARPRGALAIADELTRQLAAHYGAQRRHDLKSRYEEQQRLAKQELAEARSAQERLEVELQGLRHAQLTSALAASVPAPPATAMPPAADSVEPRSTELKRTLDSLKVERDRLLEVYLPAHPQVQALVAQISHLEDSLKHSSAEAEDDGGQIPTRDEKEAGGKRPILEWKRDSAPAAAPPAEQESNDPGLLAGELTAAIQNAQLDLLAATHRRQQAEQQLQSLSTERANEESVGSITWSIQRAQIVGSGSGSHGSQQLALALLASVGGGLAAAWLTRLAARDRPLASVAEVGRSLALPVLGTLVSSHEETSQLSPPTQAQWGANLITRCAEVVMVTFAVTLLAAVALDRGLLADLMVDPLGSLSELVRRLV